MLLFLTPFRRRRRRLGRTSPSPTPPPPVPANVLFVSGSFGDDQTLWTFDQPVTVLAGATWEMFTLHEDGGEEERVGVSAVQLTGTTLRITMNAPPEDFGNGWFWVLTSVPLKVKTTGGAAINAGEGDLTLG
jgi:hypothetical protein